MQGEKWTTGVSYLVHPEVQAAKKGELAGDVHTHANEIALSPKDVASFFTDGKDLMMTITPDKKFHLFVKREYYSQDQLSRAMIQLASAALEVYDTLEKKILIKMFPKLVKTRVQRMMKLQFALLRDSGVSYYQAKQGEEAELIF